MIRRDQIEDNFANAPPNILEVTRTHNRALTWLTEMEIISEERPCVEDGCDGVMTWTVDSNRPDGQIFRCLRCYARCSIRRDTIFEGSRLTLMELARVYFHYFLNRVSIRRCSLELNLSKKSVGRLYTKIRRAISDYVIDVLQAGGLLGTVPQQGPNVPPQHQYPVVEVDESLFAHTTQHGVRQQVWVFGIFDRGTQQCRMFVVPNRSAETLEELIQEHVAVGAVIYSDGWAGYNGLVNLGYQHRRVLHNQGFGFGLDTTNGIESCWS